MSKKLFVIDGMAHIYRAYFAVRGLSNSKGLPTNAIFGFITILRKIQAQYNPDYIVVAMDSKEPSFRKTIYSQYKANRTEMPQDLQVQIPYIFKLCEALSIPIISISGYEADDIIGTISDKIATPEIDVVIVTNDKDMAQLVTEHVSILRVDSKSGEFVLCNDEVVVKWLGVNPNQVVDVLALWGDSSDNVPGAPGIGEKGAIQLIQQFGNVDEALERYSEVKRKTYSDSLRDNREQILRAKQLITICRTVPISFDLASFIVRSPNRQLCYELFSELEFKSLIREFTSASAEEGIKLKIDNKIESNYIELTKLQDIKSFLENLNLCETFAFYVEKLADQKIKFSVSLEAGQSTIFESSSIEGFQDIYDQIMKVLVSEKSRKIFYDTKSFLHLIDDENSKSNSNTLPFEAVLPIRVEGLSDDIMIAAYLLNPSAKQDEYSLTSLGKKYLTISDIEAEHLNKADLINRLRPHFNSLLQKNDLIYVYKEIELPLINVLCQMECTGIKIDSAPLIELEHEIQSKLELITQEIYDLAGQQFNINSPQQVAEIFEHLGYDVSKKTSTGKISTSAEVLEELSLEYSLPRLILDYREYEKLLNTYVTVLPKMVNPLTGRLHTTFNQTVAATGRLSSTQPNIQNIPVRTELGRKIRQAFVAKEDHLLISADYSQIELRLLAHITGDPAMTTAFQNNEDIHTHTAREVFGAKTEEELKRARRLAKATNFGIAYGVGPFGLARNVGISIKEARKVINDYFAKYPGIKRYMEEVPQIVRSTGCIKTIMGRLRYFPDINSRNHVLRTRAEREAINMPLQGAAADLMKLAMIQVAQCLKKQGLQARMLLQVHDEILLESPIGEVEEISLLVKDIMENVYHLNIPLIVNINKGKNWFDMK